jgi:4-hydroxybenzoate polyprenyltransferase
MSSDRLSALPWSELGQLIRLRNQTGSLLLLFPTLWALLLASNGHPSFKFLAIFILATFVMRSAGVIINDVWDRDLDRRVLRTQNRPLASGRLSLQHALAFLAILLLIAAALVLLLNPLTIALSVIALLLAIIYPLAKRVLSLPQALLGIAFGWGSIMAWSAVRDEIGWPAVGIFLATICWAIGYDTIYALQDKEDDLRARVHSSAIFFGSRVWLAVLVALLLMIMILGLVGIVMALHWPFYAMLFVVTVWGGRQTWQLKQGVSPAVAFALFKQHVWIGLLILIGMWAGLLLR